MIDLDTMRLGTDADLPVGFDEEIGETASGDVPTASGRPNILTAIRRRLATQPGALVYRPTYGCGVLNYIGNANSPAKRADLATKIRTNLLQDLRIKDATVTVTVGTPTDSGAESALSVLIAVTLRDDTKSTLTLSW